jgi:xanthine dehydrogenase accessory factor
MSGGVLVEAGRLAAAGEPFALVTVLDVTRPASTRRGDRALVTADGRLVGWVGGACSEQIVVREALRALADGEPRLVRIGPRGRVEEGAPAHAVVAESSCASEGIVEVFVEPELPAPLLAVVGKSPAAETLVLLASTIGWRVARDVRADADAVVVATMGHGDEGALADALAAQVGYVGLVASSRRAQAVVSALRERGLDEDALARVRSPSGLDLGPSNQQEIAVAVLAELVAWRHRRPTIPATPATAIDPVCGMEVVVDTAGETAMHGGASYYFCSAGCRSRFEAEPGRYLEITA